MGGQINYVANHPLRASAIRAVTHEEQGCRPGGSVGGTLGAVDWVLWSGCLGFGDGEASSARRLNQGLTEVNRLIIGV